MLDYADTYLRKLCVEIPGREVGSEGNKEATDFFARVAASRGFAIDAPTFDCVRWLSEGARLWQGELSFEVFSSPFSLGCHVSGPLAVASSVEELEACEIAQKILLLRGGIAREQLMPKNFPFYNPDDHRRVVQLLEARKPSAIVSAGPNDAPSKARHPLPLIEDGDFDIPSVYTSAEEGCRLAEQVGGDLCLESKAQRIPATGRNVIARKGSGSRRIVILAHIDAKQGTPGAIDNAGGVVVLLLLAELLRDHNGEPAVEIVALNGEDHYANPGEQQYLRINAGRFDEIALGVNVDGAGYRTGKSAYSLYGCPPALARAIREVFSKQQDIVEGPPWYEGDHGLFLRNQRPALALTSELAPELLATLIHTASDSVEVVDTVKLVNIAVALRELVLRIAEAPAFEA